jgi:hypothetical protein
LDSIADVTNASLAKEFDRRKEIIREKKIENLMMYWSCISVDRFGTWPEMDDEVLKSEVKMVFEWTLDALLERRIKDLGKLFSSVPDTSQQRM